MGQCDFGQSFPFPPPKLGFFCQSHSIALSALQELSWSSMWDSSVICMYLQVPTMSHFGQTSWHGLRQVCGTQWMAVCHTKSEGHPAFRNLSCLWDWSYAQLPHKPSCLWDRITSQKTALSCGWNTKSVILSQGFAAFMLCSSCAFMADDFSSAPQAQHIIFSKQYRT